MLLRLVSLVVSVICQMFVLARAEINIVRLAAKC